MTHPRILEAIRVLQALGVAAPSTGRLTARDGLALLALLMLPPGTTWADASTPIISLQTVAGFPAAYELRPHRDMAAILKAETLPAFEAAGIVRLNPNTPGRPRRSPHTVYQVPYPVCELLRRFGSKSWPQALKQAPKVRRSYLEADSAACYTIENQGSNRTQNP